MRETTGIGVRRLFYGRNWQRVSALILIEYGVIGAIDFSGCCAPRAQSTSISVTRRCCRRLVDTHVHLTWGPHADPENLAIDTDEMLLARARRHAVQAPQADVTTIRDLGDRAYASVALQQPVALRILIEKGDEMSIEVAR